MGLTDSPPLVSVAMPTYKHRAFIGQAIESVLAQRRDFPIEIVVSDDCSPDGAGEVVSEYHARHPDLIRRIDPPQNVGWFRNWSRAWSGCRGKYIAMLEGDDWWHSPDKLASQVAFMERHPGCAISGHRVRVQYAGQAPGAELLPRSTPPPIAGIARLIQENYLPTCSVMCRAGLVPEIPHWARPLPTYDWVLWLLHGTRGVIGFIDETHSTYRLHGGGFWSTLSDVEQYGRMEAMADALRGEFPPDLRRHFDDTSLRMSYYTFLTWRYEGKYGLARKALVRHILRRIRKGRLTPDMLWRFPLLLLFPGLRRK